MKIDTHQHFWKYNVRDYVWMGTGMDKLRKDHLPTDLLLLINAAGISATVAVQARQSLEESTWLLQLADEYSFIRAVVGWVDLTSERVVEQLEQLAQHPKFRGVRHVVHDEADDKFMLRESFLHGLSQLKRFGLTYDLLLFPRHLPIACDVVKRFPDQLFVLDHIAKPPVRAKEMEPWARDLKRLASFANVSCKISGLVTEAKWSSWEAQDFEPYLDVVLNAFGPHRLMIGSDWPVCTLAADYTSVINLETDYIARLSGDERNAILEKNAIGFYSIRF
ncbi:MAG: amidohydrolase [Acidobacteria bacterium]|nr:MAG: amidohydrolase [Acidobacteriota bacterium]